jgi:hypothetical protein
MGMPITSIGVPLPYLSGRAKEKRHSQGVALLPEFIGAG